MMIALLFQLATAPRADARRDTALEVVNDVAMKVGAIRSSMELWRRAAYNDAIDVAAQREAEYAGSCKDLAAIAKQDRPRLCRACMENRLQAAMDAYRAYLPTLERFGNACFARVTALKPSSRASSAAQVAAMRAATNAEGAKLVTALRGYEAKVAGVRSALIVTAPPPPRPARRP